MGDNPTIAQMNEYRRLIGFGKKHFSQHHYADAQTAYANALAYLAAQKVTISSDVLLENWYHQMKCYLGMNDFDLAQKYHLAAINVWIEWGQNSRNFFKKNRKPSSYTSYALVKPLIPDGLNFTLENTYPTGKYLEEMGWLFQLTRLPLETVDLLARLLWIFARFHCGPSVEQKHGRNWSVLIAPVVHYGTNMPPTQIDSAILVLREKPRTSLTTSYHPEGCWFVLSAEESIPEQARHQAESLNINSVTNTIADVKLPRDTLACWKLLNQWVKHDILLVQDDHFVLNIKVVPKTSEE